MKDAKTERAQGKIKEVGGTVRETVGAAVGNERIESQGKADRLEGQARQEAAKASERARGAVEQAGGAIKRGVGEVIGNEQMEAEGKAKELKGKARRGLNE
jgi:uncharacterized protein YjbJ (UPF0337 family)